MTKKLLLFSLVGLFFLSNYKLQLFIDILVEQKIARLEFDSNEEQRVVILNSNFLDYFVEWYAIHLQTPEKERVAFREKELEPDEHGDVVMSISEIISTALSDYEANLTVNHIDIFETKDILESSVTSQRDIIFNPERLYFVYLSWHLLHTLRKVPHNA